MKTTSLEYVIDACQNHILDNYPQQMQAHARQELTALVARVAELEAKLKAANERVDRAEAEANEFAEYFVEYGKHLKGCRGSFPCRCGFDKAITSYCNRKGFPK